MSLIESDTNRHWLWTFDKDFNQIKWQGNQSNTPKQDKYNGSDKGKHGDHIDQGVDNDARDNILPSTLGNYEKENAFIYPDIIRRTI